jgi:hypothetical protein
MKNIAGNELNYPANVRSPEVGDDVAEATMDLTVQDLADRTAANKKSVEDHTNLTDAHGASILATPNRLALRDGSGRLEAGAGVSGNDVVIFTQLEPAKSIGLGQVWTAMTIASAASDRFWYDGTAATRYRNLTGRPIQVKISGYTPAGTVQVDVSVDGVTYMPITNMSMGQYATMFSDTFIVPPNHYYRATRNNAAALYNWSELR